MGLSPLDNLPNRKILPPPPLILLSLGKATMVRTDLNLWRHLLLVWRGGRGLRKEASSGGEDEE